MPRRQQLQSRDRARDLRRSSSHAARRHLLPGHCRTGSASCEYGGPDDCALGGSADRQLLRLPLGRRPTARPVRRDPVQRASRPLPVGQPPPEREHRPTRRSRRSATSTTRSVTDPLGDAWIDQSRQRGRRTSASRATGRRSAAPAPTAWNEVINGGHYYLQEEWSNDDGSCQPRDEAGLGLVLRARRAPAARKQSTFAGAGRRSRRLDRRLRLVLRRRRRRGASRVATHMFKRAGRLHGRAADDRQLRATGRSSDADESRRRGRRGGAEPRHAAADCERRERGRAARSAAAPTKSGWAMFR